MYYSDNDLDSPPPQSQFRRPWSPEPYDPNPPGTSTNHRGQPDPLNRYHTDHIQEPSLSYAVPSMSRHQHQHARREASEVSVEALDLADYARTLRARQAEDPYPPFPSQFHPEPQPQSRSHSASSFPRAPSPASRRDSHNNYHVPAPSPISRGPTFSSSMTYDTLATRRSDATHPSSSSHPPHSSSSSSRGRGSSSSRPGRRPFSVPNTPNSRTHHHPPSSYPARGPHIANPLEPDPHAPQEIDISNFPRWSRGWYTKTPGSGGRNHYSSPMEIGVDASYPPAPQLDSLNSENRQSIFDPEYKPDPYGTNQFTSSDIYDIPPPLSSLGHDSTRNLLPWSNLDPPDYSGGSSRGPIDPQIKAERLRLLEREFGSQGRDKGNGAKSGHKLVDDEGKPLVGTVDGKGALVTSGPKRRIAVRASQLVFALGASIPAIYAAIAIKPSSSTAPVPPPANKPPAYVLYVASCLTFVICFYLFAIHPCCARRRTKSTSGNPSNPLHPANMGMMVLPVSTIGGKKGKPGKAGGGKGGKKGKHAGPGDVQVNLIVDPAAFRGPEDDEDDYDSADDDGYGSTDGSSMPGGFGSGSGSGARRKRARRQRARARRRGIFEGLAMEEEWKRARGWAKKMAFVDVSATLVWGAVFVFVMIGERCPTGGFNGWCDAYNVSTASACLLCVAFAFSVFFDVQDLHASKQSPRTRT